MKLKQVKEFNSETITQKIAGEICSILIWNHFDKDKYLGQFEITDTEPKGVLHTGGSKYPWRDEDAENGYIKTSTGVRIKSPYDSEVRIFENGKASPIYLKQENSSFETIKRHIPSGSERLIKRIPITHGSQVDLVQCYINNGFYIVEL